jgi:hypothetical protein
MKKRNHLTDEFCWKNNIKVDLKEILYEDVNSITLALKVHKGHIFEHGD